jgi:hypothetical protein
MEAYIAARVFTEGIPQNTEFYAEVTLLQMYNSAEFRRISS